MATNINNKLVCNEPHANLDSYYGPYNSVDEAYNALADRTVNGVTYTKKVIGLTVGIWNAEHTEITEYWFKGGLSKSNLVEKTSGGGGGLPGNIKIVTFDKNSNTASGVMNSVISDADSKVMLPQCTFTSSDEFRCWSYGGAEFLEGAVITVGTSTVVQAIWQSSPKQYTVSWNANPGNGITSITGNITNGARVNSGTNVTLTANVASGYTFDKWLNTPAGPTIYNNTLAFTVNSNVSGITATGRAITTTYTVSWINADHVSVTGIYGTNTPIESGVTQIPAGSRVVLTATPDSGHKFTGWSNPPSGSVIENNVITIRSLNSNVSNVKANVEPIVMTHQIRIGDNGGVQSYEVTIEGRTQVYEQAPTIEGISSGVEVQIKVNPKDGYAFDSCVVSGASPSTTENPIKFTMKDADVSVNVTTKQDATNEFNYFACGAPNSKGGIEGDQPDNSVMWFKDVNDLSNCKSGSVKIENTNKYTIFYVVSDRTDTPILTVDSNAKNFDKLHECQDSKADAIRVHFYEEVRWVEAGTNKTTGDLKAKGNYIYILIGKEQELGGKSLTISFNK